MIAKKPVSKSKVKNHSAAETQSVSKGKPTADAKSATLVMDVRLSQDRRQGDRREKDEAVEVERRSGPRRAKVNRRRQIDPTTCERDYSPAEVEFMGALDDYKRRSDSTDRVACPERIHVSSLKRLRNVLGGAHAKRDALDQSTDIAAAAAAFETAGGCAYRIQPVYRRAARAHYASIAIGKNTAEGVRHTRAQGHGVVRRCSDR